MNNNDRVKIRQESTKKVEFINYLIRRTELAGEDDQEFYSKRKKIIVDFFPTHSWQEQKEWLNDLKKKKIIGNFEEGADCFYLIRPVKLLLYREQQKLLDIINPPQKQKKEGKIVPLKITIKNVRLDGTNYLLKINKGEKFVSFKSKTDIELSEEKLISERDGLMNKLNIQHDIEAKIDLFKETCHKFLSKINDPKIVTERLKKDIIKLIIDEVAINGEKLNISATIPLPNKIHEREIVKTDSPDTFNAGATLGPINQTKMERIWTKHKQINTTLKPKIFVAMSGGVDSSVAAALLKKEGYNVTGVHMICWDGCENSEDRRDAMRVAAVLDIPFLIWDFREEYKKEVYDYMIREYVAGCTPNPDVMCNKQIKFGVFLKKALESGADYIATGHYVCQAKIVFSSPTRDIPARYLALSSPRSPRLRSRHRARSAAEGYAREPFSLYSAKDQNKDQSYFLWTLTQDQLKYCLFPIGDYLKSEVRKLARKFKLPTSEKKDSQGLCFVGKVDFLDFLKEKIPSCAGNIVDFSGKKIGVHEGAQFYTIGQRHGLSLGGQKNPVYVARKNIFTNTITVAEEKNDALHKKELTVENINWVSGKIPKLPLNCLARIRYRQPLQKAVIYKLQTMDYKPIFDVPQRAVAQGQSTVFYTAGGEMLGGGIIKD